jgi:hypothetical protein
LLSKKPLSDPTRAQSTCNPHRILQVDHTR